MQIAQVLSGYSLGEADLLRRAMGKKQPAEMAKQKSRFIDGAKERGVSESLAAHIFDLVEEFAGYGFNKSHAAAYAVVAYQTAYLKAHYPVDFVAASMSLDLSNSDKLASFHQDARRIGVTVLPPDLNASEADFSVEAHEAWRGGALRAGRGAQCRAGGDGEWWWPSARRAGGFKALLRFRRTARPQGDQSPAIGKSRQGRRVRCAWSRTARARSRRAKHSPPTRSARAEERASAQASLFGADEPSARPAFPKAPVMVRRRIGSTPNAKASAFIFPATRSRISSPSRASAIRASPTSSRRARPSRAPI